MRSGLGWPGSATPRRGPSRRKPGRAWAARTGPDTHSGGGPRRRPAPGRRPRPPLAGGRPAAAAGTAPRAAAAAADGHAPLLAEIRTLAERARIPLGAPTATTAGPPGAARLSHGLTARELAVLRLLAAGRTNAQIGAELYIRPKTAGVHVSHNLPQLGVSLP